MKTEKNRNIIKNHYRYKKYEKESGKFICIETDFYKSKHSNFILRDYNDKGKLIEYIFKKHTYKPYFLYEIYWKFTIWKSKPINRKFKTIYKLSLFQRITVFGMIIAGSWALYIYSDKNELKNLNSSLKAELTSSNNTVLYLKNQLDSLNKEFLELKRKTQKSEPIKELKE